MEDGESNVNTVTGQGQVDDAIGPTLHLRMSVEGVPNEAIM